MGAYMNECHNQLSILLCIKLITMYANAAYDACCLRLLNIFMMPHLVVAFFSVKFEIYVMWNVETNWFYLRTKTY